MLGASISHVGVAWAVQPCAAPRDVPSWPGQGALRVGLCRLPAVGILLCVPEELQSVLRWLKISLAVPLMWDCFCDAYSSY